MPWRLFLAAAVLFTVATTHAAAEEPKKDAKTENQLVGTWKLVSAKFDGKEFELPSQAPGRAARQPCRPPPRLVRHG
jgi:hypothetical protein